MSDQPQPIPAPDPIGNAVSFLTSAAKAAAEEHILARARMKARGPNNDDPRPSAELAQAFAVIDATATLVGSLFVSLDRIAGALAAVTADLEPAADPDELTRPAPRAFTSR